MASIRTADILSSLTTGKVEVLALANQKAFARSIALSVSSGASVGSSFVEATDTGSVVAELGDDVRVVASVLRIHAKAQDDVHQRASASSGGVFAGLAGSYSNLKIEGTTRAGLGDRNQIAVGLLDIWSTRTQNFDAVALNLAVGALAGSGAAMLTTLTGTSNVKIGQNSKVVAGNIAIRADNMADKNRYSATEDSLRSGSAGLASLTALGTVTTMTISLLTLLP
jgi:hypothetical protein